MQAARRVFPRDVPAQPMALVLPDGAIFFSGLVPRPTW
jgi:hypothetical protein